MSPMEVLLAQLEVGRRVTVTTGGATRTGTCDSANAETVMVAFSTDPDDIGVYCAAQVNSGDVQIGVAVVV